MYDLNKIDKSSIIENIEFSNNENYKVFFFKLKLILTKV